MSKEDPIKASARKRKHYQQNREKILARKKQYYAENRDACRARIHRYRQEIAGYSAGPEVRHG